MPTNRFHHLIAVGLLVTVGLFLMLTAQAGLTAAATDTSDASTSGALQGNVRIHGKSTPGDVQTPAWSPDGRKLAFVSRRDGNSEIYVMNADAAASTFYGLADYAVQEVVEFYASRQDAERNLRDVLRDEPDWEDMIGLVQVEFGWEEARVERVVHRPQQFDLPKHLPNAS